MRFLLNPTLEIQILSSASNGVTSYNYNPELPTSCNAKVREANVELQVLEGFPYISY